MAQPRHLTNAPLIEALLDIRVAPSDSLTLDTLLAAEKALAPAYHRKAEKKQAGFELLIDRKTEEATAKATASKQIGFVLEDETKKKIVQLTMAGFTQNLLKPYSEFESLVSEAQRSWRVYVDMCRPQQITRVALRYINDLRLPISAEFKFEDYLPYTPQVPPALPQTVSDFASRVTISHGDTGIRAIVSQAYQGIADQTGVRVILDIDASDERPMDVDDPALWERFSTLRSLKNDAFFSFVDERLLEKYQ